MTLAGVHRSQQYGAIGWRRLDDGLWSVDLCVGSVWLDLGIVARRDDGAYVGVVHRAAHPEAPACGPYATEDMVVAAMDRLRREYWAARASEGGAA